eukprot:TRINITY_DN30664_c0_g1_i1.p2 TRINITY_DN30664_c0_g1~~TRINITY_DN30664_c0_g1_i1.p2  ORF type:complete len:174 (+),score=10.00 TRINITY_DN30664_c0_g1_i1:185-706(+)
MIPTAIRAWQNSILQQLHGLITSVSNASLSAQADTGFIRHAQPAQIQPRSHSADPMCNLAARMLSSKHKISPVCDWSLKLFAAISPLPVVQGQSHLALKATRPGIELLNNPSELVADAASTENALVHRPEPTAGPYQLVMSLPERRYQPNRDQPWASMLPITLHAMRIAASPS